LAGQHVRSPSQTKPFPPRNLEKLKMKFLFFKKFEVLEVEDEPKMDPPTKLGD
jgi:hypothetical protein